MVDLLQVLQDQIGILCSVLQSHVLFANFVLLLLLPRIEPRIVLL